MMKKVFFVSVLFFLLFTPQFEAAAQSNSVPNVFDMTDFPQWAKDLRRFDVIAFGTFPFSMFFATLGMDTYRFAGTGWSDDRYAPWARYTTASAVDMTAEEYGRTILLAAGISLVIALTDFVIVSIKRSSERRRIESRPSGSFNINRGSVENSEAENSEAEDGGDSEPANIEDIEIDEDAAAAGAAAGGGLE
jgi:hypothetical protein